MQSSDFSRTIDLGREESALSPSEPATASAGKKGKKRVFYPTLYIDAVEGMPTLPKEFVALVKCRRKRMSVEENHEGKETSGVTLEIQELCLTDEDDPDEGEGMESAMKKFAKESGVADAAADNDEDDADEDDDGE